LLFSIAKNNSADWNTLAACQTYLQSPGSVDLADRLQELCCAKITSFSASFSTIPPTPLAHNAPIVEIFTCRLFPHVQEDMWSAAMEYLADSITKRVRNRYYGIARASLDIEKGDYVFLSGWEDYETQLELVRMMRVGEPDDDLVKARMRMNRCFGMERIMDVKMEGVLEGQGSAAILG
jgi:hypothetical protein